MDYSLVLNKALQHYSIEEPEIEFIRHNENLTCKVTEKKSGNPYLLRLHKPVSPNLKGVQSTPEAVQSELEFLRAWSVHSDLPAQTPVASRKGEWVTTVSVDQEEAACTVLRWIEGEVVPKRGLDNEEAARNLGSRIAELHLFSRSFQPGIRPEYGIDWVTGMLGKLRIGEQEGILSQNDFQMIEQTISMMMSRMTLWEQKKENWGFIHADINFSNLIRSSKGISFIDFSLSGYGYYAMDVAMGALLVKGELRDELLSGYSERITSEVNLEQLEAFMFLAIIGYYSFVVDQPDQQEWIKEHVSGLVENLCKPLLSNKSVFYQI